MKEKGKERSGNEGKRDENGREGMNERRKIWREGKV